MHAYGLSREEDGDRDVGGCVTNGRATRIYSLGRRAYRSLRNGKKRIIRRIIKRIERRRGNAQCREEV